MCPNAKGRIAPAGQLRREFVVSSAVFGITAVVPLWARAASTFPERTIVIVDPATPSGSTDYFSRALAEEMSRLLGKPVVVENKPGAGGAFAAEFVARAKPDGYTLGLAAVSTHAANPALNKAIRYDAVKDFSPITMMLTLPSAVGVRAQSPIRTLSDLLDAARLESGRISFASPGVGTAGHVLLEQFSQLAGVKFLHVPYRESADILNDLLGGELNAASDNIPALLPLIKSGRLRAIAVRNVRRVAQLPDVPTFGESGFESVNYRLGSDWWHLQACPGNWSFISTRLRKAQCVR